MIHQRQGLLFGRKARDHLPRVHPRLDDLQGHLATDGFLLGGHVDHAHATFADLLDQLVRADLGAGAFGDAGWSMVAASAIGSTPGNAALFA